MTIPFPNAQSSDEALANAKYFAILAEEFPQANDREVIVARGQLWATMAMAMPMVDTVILSGSDRTTEILRAALAQYIVRSGGGPFVMTDRDLAVWSGRQMVIHEDTEMGLIRVRLDEP
jgi:hypothetical protein